MHHKMLFVANICMLQVCRIFCDLIVFHFLNATPTSVSTWMGDHQGRPGTEPESIHRCEPSNSIVLFTLFTASYFSQTDVQDMNDIKEISKVTGHKKSSLSDVEPSEDDMTESIDEVYDDTHRRLKNSIETKSDDNTRGRSKSGPGPKRMKNTFSAESATESSDEDDNTRRRSKSGPGPKQMNNTISAESATESSDEDDGTRRSKSGPKRMTNSSRKRSAIRQKWSNDELIILRRYLSGDKPPDNDSVRLVMERFPILQKRTIPQVKSRTWHMSKTGR